jgi:hypothetical protein
MKKNFVLNILYISLLFTACKKDFLSREPQDAYSNATLWTSASDAAAALAGVYNSESWSYSDDGNGWASATWIVYLDCLTLQPAELQLITIPVLPVLISFWPT